MGKHSSCKCRRLLQVHYCVQAQEVLEQLKADEKQAWTELLRAEQGKVAEMRLECARAQSSLRDAEHALACQQVRGLAMTPWP